MSKRLAAFLFAALPVAVAAAPETFSFDPTDTVPHFVIDHFFTPDYGRFNKSAGKMTIDRAAKTASVEFTIETASVDTADNDKGNRPRSRDEHLRSSDFFNVAEFPRMTYKSTQVSFTGDTPTRVEGNLTLLGVTKPVTLTIERFKCNPASATAKERCGGFASGKIKRSEFGMTRNVGPIGDEVTLLLGFGGDKE